MSSPQEGTEQQEEKYRMPFEQAWDQLPGSVQNRVRTAIIMCSIFTFLMGILFGVML